MIYSFLNLYFGDELVLDFDSRGIRAAIAFNLNEYKEVVAENPASLLAIGPAGLTALHIFIADGHKDAVEFICGFDEAPLTTCDCFGRTPIDIAMEAGNHHFCETIWTAIDRVNMNYELIVERNKLVVRAVSGRSGPSL